MRGAIITSWLKKENPNLFLVKSNKTLGWTSFHHVKQLTYEPRLASLSAHWLSSLNMCEVKKLKLCNLNEQEPHLFLNFHRTIVELLKTDTTKEESDSNQKFDQLLLIAISMARISSLNSAKRALAELKLQPKLPKWSPTSLRKMYSHPANRGKINCNPN